MPKNVEVAVSLDREQWAVVAQALMQYVGEKGDSWRIALVREYLDEIVTTVGLRTCDCLASLAIVPHAQGCDGAVH